MLLPIRYKLLSLVLIVIIPVCLISAYHYIEMVDSTKNDIQSANKRIARNIAQNISSLIERSFSALNALAKHPAVIRQDSRACDRLFGELLPSFPSHLNIIAADMNGNNYGSAGPDSPVRRLNHGDREWFRRARKGVAVVGDLHISKLFNLPSVMIAQPVFDRGRQVGVLGMALDLTKVRADLAAAWKFPPHSTSNVIDASGNVVICICEDEAARGQGDRCQTVKVSVLPAKAGAGIGSGREERLFSFAPVPRTDWKVLIAEPAETASRLASSEARRYLIVIAAGTLAAVVVSLIMSGRIAKNVSSIVTAMKEVERGNLAVQVPAVGNDELGTIASSFNEMVRQRMEAEERLKHSESFLSSVLDGIGEGVVVIDRDYRIISANDGYGRQLKVRSGDCVGRHCYEVAHQRSAPCFHADDECDCAVFRCFQTGRHHRGIHRHLDADGNQIYIEVRAYPLRNAAGAVTAVIETLTDVTDRRTLEAQLRQAQKMEAVGLLAGGVAHDFNNILTAIIGYGSLLKMKLEPGHALTPFADQILASADRASHLTRSLLAFSRKQIIDPRPVRLNEVIQRVETLLSRLVNEDVDLQIALAPREATVLADPHQVEQVLMNLCTNARDAMPRGGRLTISTDLVEIDELYRKQHPYATPGRYMRISVTDTGTGMDEAMKEKIFEPFFTTKERGKGTGLGLSIIYGIVKQHKGFIDVESEVGKGTTFTVHLPATEGKAETLKQSGSEPAVAGTGVILLAEDDASVRTLAANILKEHGYRVIVAADGVEAVAKFNDHAESVDLVLLDVLMPRKNGKEACDELRMRRSDVKVLFMSGYTPDLIHEKGILDRGIELLHKPFSPGALLEKVRQMLSK